MKLKSFGNIYVGTSGIFLIIIGIFGIYLADTKSSFLGGREWSIAILSIGCSIFGAVVVESFNNIFHNKEFKEELIENMGDLFKTSEEWGLLRLVPSKWNDFYNEIHKSREIKYFAYNSLGIFSDLDDRRRVIIEFLLRGGKLDLIVQKDKCEAFEVRKKDWDEKSQIFESQIDQVKSNFLKVLKELNKNKVNNGFRIRIRSTENFIYGTLVIFDQRLYHYTLNSNAWKIDNGVSIQARSSSKLGDLFKNLFNKNFENGEIYYFELDKKNKISDSEINFQNIENIIQILTD